jgi:hypothetical protein
MLDPPGLGRVGVVAFEPPFIWWFPLIVENEELDPLGWISTGFVPDLDLNIS